MLSWIHLLLCDNVKMVYIARINRRTHKWDFLKKAFFFFSCFVSGQQQQADFIRAQEKQRQEVFQSLLEVCFPKMQWQYPSLWPWRFIYCFVVKWTTHLFSSKWGGWHSEVYVAREQQITFSVSIWLKMFLLLSFIFAVQFIFIESKLLTAFKTI